MPLLVSVNVGRPRDITWDGGSVSTGFLKTPVDGPVALRRHNLEGDRQADLSVHGGPTKAVYVYPTQHYDYWGRELGGGELPWGSFGENFTVEGIDEEAVCVGDEFRVGSARVVVTEPRMPCFKLGIHFGRADMVKRFLKSQRTGFYFGVAEEGLVRAGDELQRMAADPDGLRVADVTRLYTTEKANEALLSKASTVTALPEKWRAYFQYRLGMLRE